MLLHPAVFVYAAVGMAWRWEAVIIAMVVGGGGRAKQHVGLLKKEAYQGYTNSRGQFYDTGGRLFL